MANPLYDALFAIHAGKQTPFLHLVGGGIVTHDDFLRMTARFAHVITAAGLVPGDRLAVQIAKSPEALAVYAACVQAGVVFLPLNTAYTAAEVEYFVSNSGAKMLICDARAEAALRPVAARHDVSLHMLNADGTGSFAQAACAQPDSFDTADRSRDDLAAFLYTSGTTGR
ncbi:AMP-binding protein, partial [Brevirhabdus sp.]|uniref:AMP-binding protein n=1 Tax=Brevirhabdus sp. TaxID=2004514 RepID=UPI00405A1942